MNASRLFAAADQAATLAAILSSIGKGVEDADLKKSVVFIADGLRSIVDDINDAVLEDAEETVNS